MSGMLSRLAALGGGGAAAPTYVDDVFNVALYKGLGGPGQTITTGIDMQTHGGLLWIKDLLNANAHVLVDSARGPASQLNISTSGATTVANAITALGTSGFTLGSAAQAATDALNYQYVAMSFRKAPKFFDVVSYTGDGNGSRTIAHALGVQPGLIICKDTSGSGGDWGVWHRGADGVNVWVTLALNSTYGGATYPTGANQTASAFTPSAVYDTAGYGCNTPGHSYVAYLFAHDPAADSKIRCGYYDGASSDVLVSLGFEPQWVLAKRVNGTGGWYLFDAQRGLMTRAGTGADNRHLKTETSAAEVADAGMFYISHDGFVAGDNDPLNGGSGPSYKYIYVAIRRSNKPPTTGTQIFMPIARTGTGAAGVLTGVGFAPDIWLRAERARSANTTTTLSSKLRGIRNGLDTASPVGESLDADTGLRFESDGVRFGEGGVWNASQQYVDWFFKRASGVIDEVTYTGTGVARNISHTLGAIPELMIVKSCESTSLDWLVYHSAVGAGSFLTLNGAALPTADSTAWNNTAPTASQFTVGTANAINTNLYRYAAYLFASKAGILKIGSYTGNGSSQYLNCGFSVGARLILIKRVSTTVGHWFIFDSARGYTTTADPYLQLNSTTQEGTGNYIGAYAPGFQVTQDAATNLNVDGVSYIYMAIA